MVGFGFTTHMRITRQGTRKELDDCILTYSHRKYTSTGPAPTRYLPLVSRPRRTRPIVVRYTLNFSPRHPNRPPRRRLQPLGLIRSLQALPQLPRYRRHPQNLVCWPFPLRCQQLRRQIRSFLRQNLATCQPPRPPYDSAHFPSTKSVVVEVSSPSSTRPTGTNLRALLRDVS